MEVIPAVDLYAGKVVRLRQGRLEEKTEYRRDVAATVKAFQQSGATWIHVVDLNAAFSGKPENLDAFRRVRAAVSCKLQIGGGIRSMDDAQAWMDAGANRLVLSTLVAEDFDAAAKIARCFEGNVLASVDVREGTFAIRGWTRQTKLPDLSSLKAAGFAGVVFTDVARDGGLSGQTGGFLSGMRIPLPFYVAGGITSRADMRALCERGAAGVIIGKALYEGKLDLAEAITSC